MMPEKKQPAWSDVKRKLRTLDSPELIGLIQDLFQASADNRAFLAARFADKSDQETVLEEYRQRVIAPFFPKRGLGTLNLRDAKEVIDAIQELEEYVTPYLN